jgi:ketosteroid isomerase-like protein
MKFTLRIAIVLFVLTCHSKAVSAQQRLTFLQTVEKHVDAIKNRNLKELLDTVDDHVILVLPDGTLLSSKEEYEQLHIDWFADTQWKMETTILKTEESGELGHVLIKYKYTEKSSVAETRYTYLSMLFKKKFNSWLLIHDQNTRIQKP